MPRSKLSSSLSLLVCFTPFLFACSAEEGDAPASGAAPTQPGPTEPGPTEPGPTEPGPTEPTEPADAGPFEASDARTGVILQTSAAGDRVSNVGELSFTDATAPTDDAVRLRVDVDARRQTIEGIGGSLTQASAAALAELPAERRQQILEAYFGESGAQYSLVRTHVGSCDFSTYSYSYVSDEPDPALDSFSIQEDRDNGLLQLIKDALAVPGASFRLMASPWTAPPWMKDSGVYFDSSSQRGGQLLPVHYDTFARYMVKYLDAYEAEGIDVASVTPVNEPYGNNGGWESMEMSPQAQLTYVRDHLAPRLAEAGHDDVEIYIYDHNRLGAEAFTDVILADPTAASMVKGTAVHWYDSTVNVQEHVLDAIHEKYPNHTIMHTEGTVDDLSAEHSCNNECRRPPCGCEELYSWWQNDSWYWEKNASDWGWDWAEDRLENHPIYEPVHRYVRDVIVGFNHWFVGWIDWNVVLNKRGGPNHVGNYCIGPVMVDGDTDDVHFTPIYYALAQLSRNMRPGGVILGTDFSAPDGVVATAVLNPDQTIAVHVFNESGEPVDYVLQVGTREASLRVEPSVLQTVVVEQ